MSLVWLHSSSPPSIWCVYHHGDTGSCPFENEDIALSWPCVSLTQRPGPMHVPRARTEALDPSMVNSLQGQRHHWAGVEPSTSSLAVYRGLNCPLEVSSTLPGGSGTSCGLPGPLVPVYCSPDAPRWSSCQLPATVPDHTGFPKTEPRGTSFPCGPPPPNRCLPHGAGYGSPCL